MSPLFKKKSANQPQRRDIARARQRQAEEDGGGADRYSFRRSQTLTGSASSSVSTLSEHSAQLKSPRVKSHELTRQRRRLIALLAGCVLLAAALYTVVYQFTATTVESIDGSAMTSAKADYATRIQAYLNGRPLERLRLLTDNANLTTYLQQEYPEIDTASIDGRTGFGVSHVSLAMRKPVAEWSVNGRDLYVDQHGIAFMNNYYSDPAVKIVDHSGVRVQDGQTLVSNAFLSFVGRVVGAATTLEHVPVTQITIPPGTTRQIEVTVGGVSYPAKMTTDRSAGEQVEDMVRTIKWLQTRGIEPKYIDVRVKNEAFYR